MQHRISSGSNNNNSSGMPSVPTMPMQPQSSFAQNLAKSMTIEEMREIHRRALSEAEAKQMELRLVLASRYRELVGSSDEVTKMRERAQELHGLVHALPTLMEKLTKSITDPPSVEENGKQEEEKVDNEKYMDVRRDLSLLPRLVHRALDKDDVHEATLSLMHLFRIIAEHTNEYRLATALARGVICDDSSKQPDTLLQAQMRMTLLHVQTLLARITKNSKQIRNDAASFHNKPKYGAQKSASALSTLDLSDTNQDRDSK